MQFYRVGQVDVGVAIHGRGVGSPRWMFPDAPAATLDPVIAPYLDGDGNHDSAFSSVAVWLGDRVVVLDAGPAASPGSGTPSIVLALQAADVSPTDVDIVVISHGHDDHVGGSRAIPPPSRTRTCSTPCRSPSATTGCPSRTGRSWAAGTWPG